jgi:hypothetical protein
MMQLPQRRKASICNKGYFDSALLGLFKLRLLQPR